MFNRRGASANPQNPTRVNVSRELLRKPRSPKQKNAPPERLAFSQQNVQNVHTGDWKETVVGETQQDHGQHVSLCE